MRGTNTFLKLFSRTVDFVLPCFGPLVADLLPWSHCFNLRPVHLGFVVHSVGTGKSFSLSTSSLRYQYTVLMFLTKRHLNIIIRKTSGNIRTESALSDVGWER
jgi:hypothetical protein